MRRRPNRFFDIDPLADEEERMRDEDAYDKWQEEFSEREREEKAEGLINEQLNNLGIK